MTEITTDTGKENDMKKNQQGFPERQGYQVPQEYQIEQGYQNSPGYSQQGYTAPGYQAPQNYQTSQNYSTQQGYQAAVGYSSRSYQTPQVTGSQPPVTPYPENNAGQNAYMPQQGYTQQASQGYSYNNNYNYQQQMPYQQQSYPGSAQGYTYPGGQSGSYIPQTPYSQGYTSPGYQAPTGYNQGYNAYTQMGRNQQMPVNPNPQQDVNGQVPLNGGGYVPQPVPVRKGPFVLSDLYLLILCGVLLALFAIGMMVPGLGILRWAFVALSAVTIGMLWLKPMVANNKRLCYTIVYGLLTLVMIISIARGTGNDNGLVTSQDQTNTTQQGGNPDANNAGVPVNPVPETPVVTSTPEPEPDSSVTDRLQTFLYYWSANRQDDMLTICSPTWASKVENPKTALFGLMANRTPKEYYVESISGTENDTSRTVTITALMDRNNGKDPVKYRMSIIMVHETDGLWYVDPKSLQTYEAAETTDPSITPTPAPTAEPETYANTPLYYNPSGGEFYHRDQNCKRINERYLPLQGHFTYAELSKPEYSKLKPCAICGAPSRPVN